MRPSQISSGIGPVAGRRAGWRRLGIGVIVGFTLKGIVTTALMLMLVVELSPF